MSAPMLEVQNVSKQFGGVRALNDVTLSCEMGEVRGLIGPNGAGKSSLVNVLSGALGPDTGAVRIGEVDITRKGPVVAAEAGVARTFQNLRLFGDMSVSDNIRVAQATAHRVRPRDAESFDIEAELAQMGLAELADLPVATLSYGDQRRVEMLRALALCPRVILLDEPAAGMNDAETALLADAIERIAERAQMSMIIIDHDLGFIMRLCKTITVLDMGSVIADGPRDAVRRDPRVIEVYLGTGTTGASTTPHSTRNQQGEMT